MPEKFLYSKYSLFVLLAIFLLLIFALGREGYFNFKTAQEIKELEKKIEELKKDNAELAEMEKYLQSEEFLEKEGRLKLNLIREGEKVIIIKDETENSVATTSQSQKQENPPNPYKWWKYFFGK